MNVLIKFNRFKKKSLILLHEVLDSGIVLKKIKNLKILQTLQAFNFTQGLQEVKTAIRSYLFGYLIKIKTNIYSCLDNKRIQIWDLKTRKFLKTLEGHSEYIHCVITINENKIASSSEDKSIKIWDVEVGNCIKTIEGHSSRICCLIKVNEKKLASGSWDKTIKIWDMITGNCLKTLERHSNSISCLVKINENKIASGSYDNTIKLWDLITGNCLKTLEGHSKNVLQDFRGSFQLLNPIF